MHFVSCSQRWSPTIRLKLVAVMTLLIGMISFFIFLYFPTRLEEQAIRAIADKAQSIAEMTAFSISPALVFDDREAVEEAFASARQNEDLVYVVVVDDSGRVFVAFNKEKADRADFFQTKRNDRISQDGTVYRAMSSILSNGREIGQCYLGLSLHNLRSAIGRSRTTVAAVSLAVFVIGMVAILAISTVITHPLHRMVATVERIARGDLTQRAPVASHDEVGQLARSFNMMVGNLEAAYSALEAVNEDLEKRIGVRTKELQEEVHERRRTEEQLTSSLGEKEVLLKEIHHRVKNNLQIISSLLNLQAEAVDNPLIAEVFKESQNRIRSMSLVHEELYRSDNLAKIDVVNYIRKLTTYLFRSYNISSERISLRLGVNKIVMGVDTAIPCVLILNELVSNALKHAFPGGRGGEVWVDLEKEADDGFTLSVRDNGVGIPDEMDVWSHPSLGLQLVSTLTRQLEGRIELQMQGGTCWKITFPTRQES